jgi:peptidoglycan/LPS O-acetylase OafA/YrhL
MPNTQSITYFPVLTGLRAIAAYLVFFHHFSPFIGYSATNFLCLIFNEMHIGVSIFFVLSGFLLTYRYYDNSQLTKNWLFTYLQNRVAKIFPLYFLLTTFVFIFDLYQNTATKIGLFVLYLLNITFLKGFFDDLKLTLIAQGWSLTLEECFYFAAPFIFYLQKTKQLKFWQQHIFITFVGILLVLFFSKHIYYGFFASYDFLFNYTFLGRSAEFFIGAYFAIFFKKQQNISNKMPIIKTYLGILSIFACLVGLVAIRNHYGYDFGIRHPIGMFINNLVLPLGVVLCFWGLLTENTVVSKLLSSKLFVLLGNSSYAFYLVHKGVAEKLSLDEHSTITDYWIVFFAINLLAIALFYAIEEPARHFIRSKKIKLNFLP